MVLNGAGGLDLYMNVITGEGTWCSLVLLYLLPVL